MFELPTEPDISTSESGAEQGADARAAIQAGSDGILVRLGGCRGWGLGVAIRWRAHLVWSRVATVLHALPGVSCGCLSHARSTLPNTLPGRAWLRAARSGSWFRATLSLTATLSPVHVSITTSAWPTEHRRKVSEMAVVCFHPDNGQEAFVDSVPDMQHEATIMMEDRSCGADVGRGVVGCA